MYHTTTPGQSEPGSNSNERVLHILQSSRNGTSPFDSLRTYPGHILEGGLLCLCRNNDDIFNCRRWLDWESDKIRGAFNKFPDFFIQAFKIVVDSWKFTMLLLYILWDDWPSFMISGSNEQLQQEFEYTLLKSDCYSWWISKMQSEREDNLEERYTIKFCFKLGKNATETYGILQKVLEHLAWIEHQFLSGIRDYRKAGSLWGMMRGVGGVRKSIHQSWLAKGFELLCWSCSGRDSLGRGQHSSNRVSGISSPQLPPCHRLFDQDGHQDSSSASLKSRPCSLWLVYCLSSEAVVMRQLRRWKRLWRRSLTRSHKRTSMGRSRSCWSRTTSALQPEEIISKGTRVSCVYYQ